jgi:hypothetical protein
MMHAQYLGGPAYGTVARHLKGRAYFIPIIHDPLRISNIREFHCAQFNRTHHNFAQYVQALQIE